jgi:peptide deformylase
VTRAENPCASVDRNGKQMEFDADGLLAVCIQHEMVISTASCSSTTSQNQAHAHSQRARTIRAARAKAKVPAI